MTSNDSTQMPYRVLVPVSDNADSARAQARFVSSLPNAPRGIEATLTHVFHGVELEAPRSLRQTQRIQTVSRARKALLADGIDVQVRDSGDPYPPTKSILRLAEEIDPDLIVLGGGMHGLLDDLLTGNVAKTVGKNTDRPIAIVPDTSA